MRAKRAILTTLAVGLILPFAGGAASADVEWCDKGSPPPNDFGFRMTGSPSETSSLSWLRSTTWTATTEEFDRSLAGTLEGGVADGMRTALERAPSTDDSQVKERGED